MRTHAISSLSIIAGGNHHAVAWFCVAGIGPGDLFEVRPDPSLVAAPKEGIPSGDIVSRMRAAIGLVDDLIERVDVRRCFCGLILLQRLSIVDVAMRQDYEIPKVVATVSKPGEQPIPAPSTGAGAGAGAGAGSSGGGRGGSPPASKLPKRQSGGGGGAGTTAASTTFVNVLIR